MRQKIKKQSLCHGKVESTNRNSCTPESKCYCEHLYTLRTHVPNPNSLEYILASSYIAGVSKGHFSLREKHIIPLSNSYSNCKLIENSITLDYMAKQDQCL